MHSAYDPPELVPGETKLIWTDPGPDYAAIVVEEARRHRSAVKAIFFLILVLVLILAGLVVLLWPR